MKTQSFMDVSLIRDLVILAIIAVFVRLTGVGIDHLPVGDEMFHVLSAQSWMNNGTLSIADGTYGRASLFTKSVGVLFSYFGDTLVMARLPALIFGVLWVLLLFVFVKKNSSRLAAWIAALLFCLAPHAIELSLYSRMYTLQGFCFLLGVWFVFTMISPDGSPMKKIMLFAGALISISLAVHMHDITLVGLIALFVAVAAVLSIQHKEMFTDKKALLWIISLLMLSVIGGLAILYQYWDIFDPYWQKFITPAFANRESGIRYYHKLLTSSYPVLWLLFPFVVVVAVYKYPRFGLYCATLAVVILLMHSVAGRKAERYIYYGMPFVFALWGVAIATIIPYLNRWLSDVAEKLRTKLISINNERLFDATFKVSFVSIAIVFILSGSGAFARTINLLQGESYYFGTRLSNWKLTLPILKPLVEEAPVVVTTNFPKTLYYFGRFDIAFSPVIVADVLGGDEGALDPRNGRPAISTVESLQKLFDEYSHGIFIAEKSEWRNRFRMTEAAADLMEKNARKVELPAPSRIVAFTW